MRFLNALILPILVAGTSACSTGAQIEANRQGSILEELKPALTACHGKIDTDPRYAAIQPKMTIDGPTGLHGLTNSSKPTKEEIALLYSMHADVQECRKLQLDAASRAHPLRVIVFAEQFGASDEAWADMVTGKSTWGEFNRRRKEIITSATSKMIQADAEIGAGLQQQHAGEVAQRERAAAAFQQWSYQQQQIQQQQQAINAMNRPRTINCNYYGNNARCTSF